MSASERMRYAQNADVVRSMNAKFRKNLCRSQMLLSSAAKIIVNGRLRRLAEAIAEHKDFHDNNSSCELNDCGRVRWNGTILVWTIVCYDKDLLYVHQDFGALEDSVRLLHVVTAVEADFNANFAEKVCKTPP